MLVGNPRTSMQASPAPPVWGRWVGIDLDRCDLSIISDPDRVETFIVQLCELLQFTRFGKPQIVRFGVRPEIAGISFTQLIETSLVSGHLVDASRKAFIDVFSCSEYPANQAADFTKLFFGAESIVFHYHDRR